MTQSPAVWICLDFEATCDEGSHPQLHKNESELIEFAFAIYDELRDEITFRGQHYCRNIRTPLTHFCSRLTGITEEKLANAGRLADAIAALEAVLQTPELQGRPLCAVAHGSWDLELLLPANCAVEGLAIPTCLRKYVDLRAAAQQSAQKVAVSKIPSTLMDISAFLGIPMQGELHCGIDDAVQVAKCFRALLKQQTPLNVIDLEAEAATFLSSNDKDLCLDGLHFRLTEEVVASRLEDLHCEVPANAFKVVLNQDGRPSGRGTVTFSCHEDAVEAFHRLSARGFLLESGGVERWIGVRPLRDSERRGVQRVAPGDIPGANKGKGKGKGLLQGMQAQPLSGDWHCPTCLDLVFARHQACRRCGTTRPAAAATAGAMPAGVAAAAAARPGDWVCPSCQALCFASKQACFKCATPRPGLRR